MNVHFKNLHLFLTLLFLILFAFPSKGQDLLYNRLHQLESNQPEKMPIVAERYSKIWKKHPVPYYFISKDKLSKFISETDKRKRNRLMSSLLKNATKAQKHGNKGGFIKKKEWTAHKEKIKELGYFYFNGQLHYRNNYDLYKKFSLLISNGKYEFLIDQQLDLKFPESQKMDSHFYGLPSGQEYIAPQLKDKEIKMLDLINEERKKMGLSIVLLDSALSAACRYHAYDMATQNYVDHQGYDLGEDGKLYFANSVFDRIRQFYNKTFVISENISWGDRTAKEAFKGWYESKGHYKNLFNPKNRVVGIGVVYIEKSKYGYYWVFNAAE